MELPYNTPINIVCYQRKVHRINKFYRVHLKKHTTCITLKHSPSPKRGVYVRREKKSTDYSVRNPSSTGPLP